MKQEEKIFEWRRSHHFWAKEFLSYARYGKGFKSLTKEKKANINKEFVLLKKAIREKDEDLLEKVTKHQIYNGETSGCNYNDAYKTFNKFRKAWKQKTGIGLGSDWYSNYWWNTKVWATL